MVSVSPRLQDLDSDEESTSWITDHRFSVGFRSLSLDSAGYSDFEHPGDTRAFAGTPDSSVGRRKRRQRQSDGAFEYAEPFEYKTIADGDIFRLIVLHPGTGSSPIRCNLAWESSRRPQRNYCCLSYAWESVHRDAAILCDGYRLPVTSNLLRALRSLRKPKTTLLIWADQICINQEDDIEKAHQVSIMKHIFKNAHKIYVWLGEADDRSEKLCEYAKRIRRGDDTPKSTLNRLLSQRELKDAIQKLLQRPWFQRVWVIPEVALSTHTTVVCGASHISWDNLVRLIRDVAVPAPQLSNFDKQVSLLGNARQRTAIITQMVSSQKDRRAHTDITQLLILAKSSKATDVRDMVYAFYGMTHLTTYPNYARPVEQLYIEITEMYINSILWENSYSSWHDLSDAHKAFQLTSILYSAGALHQHLSLPSWVPDLTYAWHLAPTWCKTTPNFVTGSSRDEWTPGIRTAFRAGGPCLETFEVLDRRSPPALRISALIIDKILLVNELTPASTPGGEGMEAGGGGGGGEKAATDSNHLTSASDPDDSPTLRYGRHFFTTTRGHVGIASPGILAQDVLAVVLGADVPFVLRPLPAHDHDGTRAFRLLCDAFVQAPAIMRGDLLAADLTLAEDIVLI